MGAWCNIGRVDLDRRICEGLFEFADRTVGWHTDASAGRLTLDADAARIDGGGTCCMQIITAVHRLIADLHHSGGRGRPLERIGDDEGDRKTEIWHVVVVERRHRAGKTVWQTDRAKRLLRRCIVLREHQAHARCILRLLNIHRGDTALADGCGCDDTVQGGALRRVFVGIGRLARHFQRAVDAIDRKSDRIGEFTLSHGRSSSDGSGCFGQDRAQCPAGQRDLEVVISVAARVL